MIINTRPKILSSKLNSLSYDKNLKVINAPLSSVESLTFNIDTINLKSRLQENGYYKNIIFTMKKILNLLLLNLLMVGLHR